MRRTMAVVLAVALAGACAPSDPGADVHSDGPGPRVLDADRLGGCDSRNAPRPAKKKDVDAVLASPGAWVRVERIDAPRAGDAVAAFSGRYVATGGDPSHVARLGRKPFGTLSMHGSTATAAAEALRLGATVTAHTGRGGDARTVTYAIATHDRYRELVFLGECANTRLANALWPEYARAIVGKTSKDARRILAMNQRELEWELTPPSRRAVAPGITPNRIMRTLGTGMLKLDVPPSWRGDGLVCTRVALGGIECWALRDVRPDNLGIGFFYDPRDPVLYVDLRRESTSETRHLLARVDLGALARAKRVDLSEKPPLGLHLTLRPSPSLAEVLADPARARNAVAVRGLTLL